MERIYQVDYSNGVDNSLFFPDLIRLGLDLAITVPPGFASAQFRFLTAECGLGVGRPRRLGTAGLTVALPVRCEDRVLGNVQLDLVPRPSLTGVHCAGASALTFNPISLTRSLMFPDLKVKSVGGQTNFVPSPEAMDEDFLGRTFDMTAHVVDVARRAIEDLLPEGCQIENWPAPAG